MWVLFHIEKFFIFCNQSYLENILFSPADESPYENENDANENADDFGNCSLDVNEADWWFKWSNRWKPIRKRKWFW